MALPQIGAYKLKPKSYIIGDHVKNCIALSMVKNGDAPFCWDVTTVLVLNCNSNGGNADLEKDGHSELFYEYKCFGKNCNCKKRIRVKDIALL